MNIISRLLDKYDKIIIEKSNEIVKITIVHKNKWRYIHVDEKMFNHEDVLYNHVTTTIDNEFISRHRDKWPSR